MKTECPYCGKLITIKKKICPECGANLRDYVTCKECGAYVNKLNSECPECGFKFKKGGWKIILTVILIFLIAVGFVSCKAAINLSYQENYDKTVRYIIESAAEIEKCNNETMDVWYNSIHKIDNDFSDTYTKDEDGNFYEDFNDALDKYLESEKYKGYVSLSVAYQQDIIELLEKLHNPPKKYSQAYEEILNLYNEYDEYYRLVIEFPSMSYKEYSEKTYEVDEELVKLYRRALLFSSYK